MGDARPVRNFAVFGFVPKKISNLKPLFSQLEEKMSELLWILVSVLIGLAITYGIIRLFMQRSEPTKNEKRKLRKKKKYI